MTWNANYATVREVPAPGVTEQLGVRVDERLAAAVREAKKAAGQVIPLRSPFVASITPEAVEALREEIERTWPVQCSSWMAERLLKRALAAEIGQK